MIKVDFEKLVETIYSDENQLEKLEDLAIHRLDLEHKPFESFTENEVKIFEETVLRYIKNGIHFIPENKGLLDLGTQELMYIAENSGTDLVGYGVNDKNLWNLTNGYIIPIRDIRNNIIFYINHSYMRDKSQKYLNIYTGLYGGSEHDIKVYGMHNTPLAYKTGLMVVVEGVFDCNVFPEFGIASSAMLGTKITKYQEHYYKRFDKLVYIKDNDFEGEMAWKKFKKTFPNAIPYSVPVKYKDSDKFYCDIHARSHFLQWIEGLKKLQS